MRFLLLTALALVALSGEIARADPDFAPDSDAWNGARRFVEVARHEAADVVVPRRIDLDTLRPTDALLVLGPSSPLPEDDLVGLVRNGGRLVIADDYGSATPLLARFGVRRIEPGETSAPRVRGEDALLVARPFYAHPLTEGVPVLVTNRPVLLEHPRLVPLFALEEGGPGVVLTGVVGQGRVVAIGDPSVFTNAMMELDGNRKFAANVVRFVTSGDPPHRLVVAAGDVRFVGSFEGVRSGPLRARIEHQLRVLGSARMPDPALAVASFVLSLLAILLLASMRDTRKEPAMPWLEASQPYVDRRVEVAHTLENGIELVAVRRLGLGPSSSRADRRRALLALGLDRKDMRRVLATLGRRGHEPLNDGPEIEDTARALEAALSRRGRLEEGGEDER